MKAPAFHYVRPQTPGEAVRLLANAGSEARVIAGGSVLRTTNAAYTLAGKIATATDANGNVTRYAYDTDDRLSPVTDPTGAVTVYGYDPLSRVNAVSDPAIQSNPLMQKTCTPDGLPASLTVARSSSIADTTNYTYDGFDRLSITAYPDSSTETLSYDADSNMLTRQTARATRSPSATTVEPARDQGGSHRGDGDWGYDLDGRPTMVGDTSAAIIAPSTSASDAAITSWDAMNRPLAVSWSPAQTAPTASTTTFGYGYDPTNRRVSQSATDNSWWSCPAATSSTSNTPNNLNRYSAVGSVAPTYDGNGNLSILWYSLAYLIQRRADGYSVSD